MGCWHLHSQQPRLQDLKHPCTHIDTGEILHKDKMQEKRVIIIETLEYVRKGPIHVNLIYILKIQRLINEFFNNNFPT